jgi:hypothetical protein
MLECVVVWYSVPDKQVPGIQVSCWTRIPSRGKRKKRPQGAGTQLWTEGAVFACLEPPPSDGPHSPVNCSLQLIGCSAWIGAVLLCAVVCCCVLWRVCRPQLKQKTAEFAVHMQENPWSGGLLYVGISVCRPPPNVHQHQHQSILVPFTAEHHKCSCTPSTLRTAARLAIVVSCASRR